MQSTGTSQVVFTDHWHAENTQSRSRTACPTCPRNFSSHPGGSNNLTGGGVGRDGLVVFALGNLFRSE